MSAPNQDSCQTNMPLLRVRMERRASAHFQPLETLELEGRIEGQARLLVLDGGGAPYHICDVSGDFSLELMVGGELGWQRIMLLGNDHTPLAEHRFWVDARTSMRSSREDLQRLWSSLEGSICRNRRTVKIDGQVVPFFIRWVRDDTHVQKASVFWEDNTELWVERFLERQAANGMIFDYAVGIDADVERVSVFGPQFHRMDPANGLRWERLPSEADVEYLMVENVYRGWQARGDDERLRRLLPRLEKALLHCMTDPLRWDEDRQLVKRPYTIDTWDFKFFGFTRDHIADEEALQDAVFMVHPDTPMCVMHGDNSGMFQACIQLARMFDAVGEPEKQAEWQSHAEHFRKRTTELCWNGEYFDHWVEVTPLELDQGGVDGARSFTLSNAYNLNRGIASHAQCVSIIRRYQRLRDELGETHFAEWVSAHPIWPKGFSGIEPGNYVNGGILTIVAGELARGAFVHGFESYAVDILQRLSGLLRKNPAEPRRDPELFVQDYLFCGYSPDGKELDGIPNAWGQAAVALAFIGGLAGITDQDRRFQKVQLSPRWAAAGAGWADVTIRYPASDGYVCYRYRREAEQIILTATGNATEWDVQILLPEGFRAIAVNRGGEPIPFETLNVENSQYACVRCTGRVVAQFMVSLAPER